jgi:hypothetical protein
MNRKPEINQRVRAAARRGSKNERGQVLPIVLVMMTTMFGVCGFMLDAGRVYLNYEQLLASTNAAALAGGEALGVAGSNPVTVAQSYSSMSGGQNVFGDMQNVTTTPVLKCYTALVNEGIPCYSDGSYNAIQVTQSVAVPMTLAKFFGAKAVTISAVATAAAAGAATTPYNVAIIVDTTASMSDSDNGSDCSGTRLSCALGGVQTLMSELYPCASQLTSCTFTNGVASNSVDQVSLFTFPNITTATTTADTTCASGNPATEDAYFFPPSTLTTGSSGGMINPSLAVTTGTGSNKKTTYTPMTYQVTNGLGSNGFLSDYRTSDTSSGLSSSSAESISIGAGGNGCAAMGDPGGAGTFYAGAIYQAAQALLYQQYVNPTAQNVMILISDGDASSSQAQMAGGSGSPGSSTYTSGSSTITLNATAGTSGTYPSYPSWNNQCAQAIVAAHAAAAAGIKVYSVAYGAESSGCSTDTSGTYKGITPCQTMKDIASSPAYFFSDYAQSGSGVDTSCAGSGASTTSINQIFQDIAVSFTVSRLVPNNLS